MNLKLYEIADEYRQLLSMIDNSDDDEIDNDSFMLALDALETDSTKKATNIGCLFRELSAESAAITDTADKLYDRAQRIDKQAERLRNYLANQMQTTGFTSISDPRVKITLKKNPPSVFLESVDSIPVEYCRVIPEHRQPDRTAIKAALKSGIDIPGCTLIQTTRLAIQ